MANFVYPVVEKGIPIPESMTGRFATGPVAKYPWETMELGDSFFVPHKLKSMESTIATAHRRFARRCSGLRFTCRAEALGTRVWRVS